MTDSSKKNRSIRIKSWMIPLGAFLATQLIFWFFSNVWSPTYRPLDGILLGKIAESQLFTEWFVIYDKPLFNVLTAFFAIIFLSSAFLSIMKDLFSKKQTD